MLALAAVATFGCPGLAQAAAVTSATLFSDSADFVGKGTTLTFDAANGDRIAASGTPGDLQVSVSGGLGAYQMQFAAPPGQALSIGVYDNAQRAPFRQAGHPGIDIDGNGAGCNTVAGRFEVKDVAFDASGAVQRLWIVFEQHCEGVTAALFGELRIGIAAPDGAGVSESSIVRWPADTLGRPRTVVPVVLRAVAPLGVAGVSVAGPDATDFGVRLDECSGLALAAGTSCR
ncbi:MAG: hypothetical protein QOE11_1483, partial [Solirubrobacteraceae bacterium]|nr:hypothetical protein [Solirubrobacteraceae bacterium]